MSALVAGQASLFAAPQASVLRPYQEADLAKILACVQRGVRGTLYELPTGGGKCLGRGTPVLMFDGTTKPVEEVVAGDLLVGPDSKPRRVLSTTAGRDALYRVTPKKSDPYVVNEAHILSLKMTLGGTKGSGRQGSNYMAGKIVNIDVGAYLRASRTFRHCAKGWRVGVDWPQATEPLRLEPYFLGLWLGDGDSSAPWIYTGDQPIADYVAGMAHRLDMTVRVEPNSENSSRLRITERDAARGPGMNRLTKAMRHYGVIGNKHIPHRFKIASRQERLDLLAGILDTDGCWGGKGFDLILKSERLLDDVIFVARSLGFAAYKKPARKTCVTNGVTGDYWRCAINGPVDQIPTRIQRKIAPPRVQRKNVLVTGLSVEPIGDGEYFGFELDGDGLFLLGDFTVTHNTQVFTTAIDRLRALGWECWILVHRRELLHQASNRLLSLGISHGLVAPNQPLSDDLVQVASIDTIGARLDRLTERLGRVRLAVIDEAHHVVANKWQRIIAAMRRALLLGVTATPFRYDGRGLGEFFGEAIRGPSIADLIKLGFLAPPAVFAPPTKLDLSKVKKRMGDYAVDQLAKVVDTDDMTRAAIQHYARICGGVPALAFCVSVEHAHNVAAAFRAGGWAAAAIDGGMTTQARDAAIGALGAGRLQILTSCEIISEGTDIPIVGAALLLRPTKSTGLYLQQVGRILRVYPGKTEAIIIDQVGNVAEHGMLDERRPWSLHGGIKGIERAVTATRRCRACHYVCARGPERCPRCNRKYPTPQARPGAPSEVRLAALPGIAGLSAERIAAMPLSKILPLARTEADLRRVAQIKGYKPGWVRHVLVERGERFLAARGDRPAYRPWRRWA